MKNNLKCIALDNIHSGIDILVQNKTEPKIINSCQLLLNTNASASLIYS
jgi:hypothetical protein